MLEGRQFIVKPIIGVMPLWDNEKDSRNGIYIGSGLFNFKRKIYYEAACRGIRN